MAKMTTFLPIFTEKCWPGQFFEKFVIVYLTGDIFGRIKRSAEIILGGDIFGHHFTQIWALISAQYFSTLKFASVEISCFPSCKSFTKIIPILHYSVKIDDFALKYYEDPF